MVLGRIISPEVMVVIGSHDLHSCLEKLLYVHRNLIHAERTENPEEGGRRTTVDSGEETGKTAQRYIQTEGETGWSRREPN